MIQRWMEVLGTPPNPIWVKVKGVPLQAWHEGVFRLIGDCAGKTVEVDVRTREMEELKEGRVQVILNHTTKMPLLIPIWVDDLKLMVTVERDEEIMEREEETNKLMGEIVRKEWRLTEKEARRCSCRGLGKEEDNDVRSPISNF
eukprot:TRINITY_DN13780_c0_g1_i5.p1 TRINITY_DN13780_c0_g1~~TRINITY_DN13780_c0_g1_i5.p1  ORF type:complete len:144 (-),score=29.00 TRINITY_DN13780_c0_g1_i5:31-462(-)